MRNDMNSHQLNAMMWKESQVAEHNNRSSCWVIVRNQVYDVSEFLSEHPGGEDAILAWAGKDATEEYEATHPPGTIERGLPVEKHLGPIDPSPEKSEVSQQADLGKVARSGVRPAGHCLSLRDFEEAARAVLSKRAWIYYSSAAEDSRSHKLNLDDWSRILLRPRILRNVIRLDLSCTILGQASRLPIFIAPTALARLGHPDGELCLVRGAANQKVPYVAAMASSVAAQDLMDCANQHGVTLFSQIYVKKKRSDAIADIRRSRELGFKALLVTVDTAVVGKREADDRHRLESGTLSIASIRPSSPTQADGENDENIQVLRGPYSSSLNWNDLSWIRSEWGDSSTICLKGISTFEDAKLAADAGIRSIYLSNHGGRQLDGSPSSLRTLLEIRQNCPEILDRCEVLLDGGIRRGSDVIKALCLGARGVGLGRPFLYALSAYGTEGVERAIQILSEEIETTMRLLGVTSLAQLGPHLVNSKELEGKLSTTFSSIKAHM